MIKTAIWMLNVAYTCTALGLLYIEWYRYLKGMYSKWMTHSLILSCRSCHHIKIRNHTTVQCTLNYPSQQSYSKARFERSCRWGYLEDILKCHTFTGCWLWIAYNASSGYMMYCMLYTVFDLNNKFVWMFDLTNHKYVNCQKERDFTAILMLCKNKLELLRMYPTEKQPFSLIWN